MSNHSLVTPNQIVSRMEPPAFVLIKFNTIAIMNIKKELLNIFFGYDDELSSIVRKTESYRNV